MGKTRKPFTEEEKNLIIQMHRENVPFKDICEKTGRSINSITALLRSLDIRRYKRRNPLANLGKYKYEDIIKYMYQQGFRIDNNQLVHITKTPVKLDNII